MIASSCYLPMVIATANNCIISAAENIVAQLLSIISYLKPFKTICAYYWVASGAILCSSAGCISFFFGCPYQYALLWV